MLNYQRVSSWTVTSGDIGIRMLKTLGIVPRDSLHQTGQKMTTERRALGCNYQIITPSQRTIDDKKNVYIYIIIIYVYYIIYYIIYIYIIYNIYIYITYIYIY